MSRISCCIRLCTITVVPSIIELIASFTHHTSKIYLCTDTCYKRFCREKYTGVLNLGGISIDNTYSSTWRWHDIARDGINHIHGDRPVTRTELISAKSVTLTSDYSSIAFSSGPLIFPVSSRDDREEWECFSFFEFCTSQYFSTRVSYPDCWFNRVFILYNGTLYILERSWGHHSKFSTSDFFILSYCSIWFLFDESELDSLFCIAIPITRYIRNSHWFVKSSWIESVIPEISSSKEYGCCLDSSYGVISTKWHTWKWKIIFTGCIPGSRIDIVSASHSDLVRIGDTIVVTICFWEIDKRGDLILVNITHTWHLTLLTPNPDR